MDVKDFSEELFSLRKKAGLSQKQLAERAGVSQSSINYWEKGERVPSILQMEKLISALNVSWGTFYKESGECLRAIDSDAGTIRACIAIIIERMYGRFRRIEVQAIENTEDYDRLAYNDWYFSVGKKNFQRALSENAYRKLTNIVVELLHEVLPIISEDEQEIALKLKKELQENYPECCEPCFYETDKYQIYVDELQQEYEIPDTHNLSDDLEKIDISRLIWKKINF